MSILITDSDPKHRGHEVSKTEFRRDGGEIEVKQRYLHDRPISVILYTTDLFGFGDTKKLMRQVGH